MYEIPQQLEYKEKIVFGLTFEQLIYALIFLPIVIGLFRLDVSLTLRVILIIFPVSLASGFMFFDLFSKIKDWYTWYKLREISEYEKINKIFGAEVKGNQIIK